MTMEKWKVSEPPSPDDQVGYISCVGVSSLPKDQKMITHDEIIWNEIFGESSDETVTGFNKVQVGLNSIIEEKNANKE